MIEKIDVSYDFGKLAKNLDNILEENMYARKKIAVDYAKDIINSGKLPPNKPSTLEIRSKGLSGRRGKSSSTKPLIDSGSLRATIKIVKDGISIPKYGMYHLTRHKISDNSWAKRFGTVGKTVVARNFLPFTKSGKSFTKGSNILARFKKIEKDFYKGLNRYLTK